MYKQLVETLKEEYGLLEYYEDIMNLEELLELYSNNIEIITHIIVELENALRYFKNKKESEIEELSDILKRKFEVWGKKWKD